MSHITGVKKKEGADVTGQISAKSRVAVAPCGH